MLGVTVQKMVSGIEVVIGVTKDPQFDHVLMFGMGGVWVELLKDTTFRLIPIDAADADEIGAAVQTHQMSVGSIVPWVMPGYGAVVTDTARARVSASRPMPSSRVRMEAPAACKVSSNVPR